MKNMGIRRLNWDSDFFGFEIGEIDIDAEFSNAACFDLLIIRQILNKIIKIENFENTFQETKVVFSKILNSNTSNGFDNSVVDFDKIPAKNASFYPLAFESGKYSRFKLDTKLNHKFEMLYSKWIDNSLNKQFADKIFYLEEQNEIIGFITFKKVKNFATVGLLAVAQDQQGKGIGRKLLSKVEKYCISQNILELRIPTQKENLPACYFYSKMGYEIIEEIIIKHYWKKQ